ncbi:trans-aconitate 2-methyltransferase [Pseudarthrobacter sp. J1738]|uniref:trans-aconitate 2-methyltransferase n=1 Tax=unclassified Pseudarthrobacter TaxID=2647000 RepID=UPI003D2E1FDF
MVEVTWDPTKYTQFGDYRDRPFFDLAGRVMTESPDVVVDLGCGPGNLTASLARRWPNARVIGLDSSTAMLERAQTHAAKHSNLEFVQGDIATWQPAPEVDVVITNAALQWVPEHQKLLVEWLRALRPGAWFALQVPGNFNAPSHELMREVADSPRWSERLAGVLRHADVVSEPAQYLTMMLDAGLQAEAWETTYQQLLQGQDPVLEWVRGTGLRPVLSALDEADAKEYEAEYSALLRAAYPSGAHGTIYPFRRTFAVGQKTANVEQ